MYKKSHILFIICGLIMSLLTVSYINNTAYAEEKTEQHGPEVTDYFTIIDEDGNSEIVQFEDIDQDDTEIESLTKEFQLIKTVDGKSEILSTYDTLEEANSAKEDIEESIPATFHLRKSRSITTEGVTSYSVEETVKEITYGVVYLHSESSDGHSYLTYSNVSNPGYDGYTTGSYAKDAAYIGTVDGKIRAMQSGVVMDFNVEDVDILEYTDASISHYYIENGYLYHRFYYGSSGNSNKYRVGYALSYMSEGKKYYSYDGHYFYSDYPTMIKDYQSDIRSHAVNSQQPYYNYYQYLSHRSTTSLTAVQLDDIVNDQVGSSSSKMKELGNEFIAHQNAYGANALLMFGVAGNESAWGTSKIANDKNNLFGHGAVDSNPYYGANGYEKPADSVKYHAEYYISKGYLDVEDWRYNGGHLGDKLSGINVRYASDPYWGEKAASIYYYYYSYTSSYADYSRYNIGIINGIQSNYKLYKEPDYSSNIIHILGTKTNGIASPRTCQLPVVILAAVTDSSGNKWYKIQSDTALNESRTDTVYTNQYNFDRDYVYIPAKDVTIVSSLSSQSILDLLMLKVSDGYITGFQIGTSVDSLITQISELNNNALVTVKDSSGKTITQGVISTGMTMSLTANGIQSQYTFVIRGDINGDGKISALDYVKVRNFLDKKNTLTPAQNRAADTNNDNKVSAVDYVKVRNHLDKKSTITQ